MGLQTTIIIPITKHKKERLSRLALRYGLSLPEFSRKILEEISEGITTESFKEYESPGALRVSFERALRDYQSGRVRDRV